MYKSPNTRFTSIKALLTAFILILTSVGSCLPVYAEANEKTERIFYQIEEGLGEYAYADIANNRYFLLRDNKVVVCDAESDNY